MKRGILLGTFLALTFTGCKEDAIITLVPPTITSMTPAQGSRGEQIIGILHGTNFSGVTSVNLGDALTLSRFKVISAAEIEVEFTVNVDAVAGPRSPQVTTAGGTGIGSNAFTILNNRAPFARLDLIPESGGPLTDYFFDSTRSYDTDGILTGHTWEFGDGKTGTGSTVTHRYRASGDYEVRALVTDDSGAVGIARFTVEVRSGSPPDPKFSISPKEGDINTIFTLNASKSTDDGKIVDYRWELGNGSKAAGQIVELDFKNSGTFDILLTVTDNDGLQNITRKDIVITDFNQEAAAEEIRFVVRRFFSLYNEIETLPAEKIVTGWSDSDGCPGRQHEITIINSHKQTTVWNEVVIIGQIEVSFQSSKRANAIAAADFTWQEMDGIVRNGSATHDFEFILEDGHWRICNFKLI